MNSVGSEAGGKVQSMMCTTVEGIMTCRSVATIYLNIVDEGLVTDSQALLAGNDCRVPDGQDELLANLQLTEVSRHSRRDPQSDFRREVHV